MKQLIAEINNYLEFRDNLDPDGLNESTGDLWLRKALQRLETEQWHKVEDELPESQDDIVLVACENDVSEYGYPHTFQEATFIAFYSSELWWDNAWPEKEKDDNIIHDVTRWKHIIPPEAP